MLPTALTKPLRANVLGVGVHAVNLRTAIEFVETSVASGRRGYICVTGVHGVMEANRSSRFREVLDRALLILPDGMPTVWVGRFQKHSTMRRVFGPEFMALMCARAPINGFRHFLYGGTVGVAEQLKANLCQRFTGIKIVGTYTPPFRALNGGEQNHLRDVVASVKPDIIWVGLSTPKQEQFMAEMIDVLDCKLMIGVGAAFDIHTHRIKDAPKWVKNAGLQWLHRLCQEPTRLWRRYLINNSTFLWYLGLQISGLQRFELGPEPPLS
jgi:N-acetylglucosaminyldiphosphoundecaprenol N-acetyl-beta-D-mannosaminyltransferase